MIKLSALLLVAALSAFSADIAGKWKAVFESRNGTREVVFTFQVSDGKLTGSAAGPQGETPITEGKVDGDKLAFTVQGDDFKAVFTGTVSGDEMKLSGTLGDRTFEMPAKRVKE